MRTRLCLLGLVVVVCLTPEVSAQQSLNAGLFERYLVRLREQLAIPGLSGVILQGGREVWRGGFGQADVDAALPARADTPYPVGAVSQAISATLLLRECVDFGHLQLDDHVRRWVPDYPDESVTVDGVLAHLNASGAYEYDASRFAVVRQILEQCTSQRFPLLLADHVLDAFAMTDAVPGADLATPASPTRVLFDALRLERYQGLLQRMATPYRVDDRGRASRSLAAAAPVDGATGLVASALDLAKFDLRLRDNLLLPETLLRAWTPAAGTVSGLGWFVQRVGNDTVVWQFDATADAYSSLVIKVPGRDLTLVLLANSDRLAAPLTRTAPDISTSLFAQIFFRIFLI